MPNATGLCECGCGETTPIAAKTSQRYGHVRGQHVRFVSGHNGRVRSESMEELAERFWSKVDRRGPDECWPWLGMRSRTDYGLFKINHRRFAASRVALGLSLGSLLTDPDVFACHTCDNPPCCNPAHLFPGGADVNNKDARHKGRASFAEKGSGTGRKLTAEQVAEIRRRYAEGGVTHRVLADEFGVTASTTARAVRGVSW